MSQTRFILTKAEYRGELRRLAIVEEDHKIVEIWPEKEKDGPQVGEIYVGEVENLPKNLEAAFVRIAPDVRCYLPLKKNGHFVFASGRTGDAPLRVGDQILVQVSREQMKSKLPSVSSELSIPGQYMVLKTGGKGISFSHKLNAEEKRRLERLMKEAEEKRRLERLMGDAEEMEPQVQGPSENNSLVPESPEETVLTGDAAGMPAADETDSEGPDKNFRLILRTNAANASNREILEEYGRLTELCRKVCIQGRNRVLYSRVYEPESSYLRRLRSIRMEDLHEILTDDPEEERNLRDWAASEAPGLADRIRLYEDSLLPLPSLIGLRKTMEEISSKKVWLKSGGCLVIEQTEAFVSIDVNSGKYTGMKKPEEAFRLVNLEAAEEAARQIRLRNLSGIILIDFINMKNPDHDEELLHVLRKYLKKDPVKTEAIGLTALHIMEITRQKIYAGTGEE